MSKKRLVSHARGRGDKCPRSVLCEYHDDGAYKKLKYRRELYAKTLADNDDSIQTPPDYNLNDAHVQAVLSRLPKSLQVTYHLYYIARLSQRQIADVFGLTQGAVSIRVRTLQNQLKSICDKPCPPDYKRLEHYLGVYDARVCWDVIERYGSQRRVAEELTKEWQVEPPLNQASIRHRLISSQCIVRHLRNIQTHTPAECKELEHIYHWLSYWPRIRGAYGNRQRRKGI